MTRFESRSIWSGRVPQSRLLLMLRVTNLVHSESWRGMACLKKLLARFKFESSGSSQMEGEMSPERLRLRRSIDVTRVEVLEQVMPVQLQWFVEFGDQLDRAKVGSSTEDLKARRRSDSEEELRVLRKEKTRDKMRVRLAEEEAIVDRVEVAFSGASSSSSSRSSVAKDLVGSGDWRFIL